SYDSAGARWITKYLQNNNAPINQWANELNAIIAKTSDRELIFDLTTTLARRYAANKMFDQAANLYHQLIAEHELEYWSSPEDGTFFYGMEAYKELIDFYQKTGQKDRMAPEKQKMKALYQKLLVYVKTKKIRYGAETLKGYEPYFK
ncbi:MAG TPA: hypothetical protein VHR47_04240, partial [Bacillota bacterium]|nr:hypothetical protein [Bacillota bacterium]